MKHNLEAYLTSHTTIASARTELARLIGEHERVVFMPSEVKEKYLALKYQLNTLIAIKAYEEVGGRLSKIKPEWYRQKILQHIAIVKSNKFADCQSPPNNDPKHTEIFSQRMSQLGYNVSTISSFEFPD